MKHQPGTRVPRVPGPAAVPARTPPPAAVRYNDWPCVSVPDRAELQPTHAISVIVPTYQAPAALALTLAGLERQDWPRELLEVVVVDDGSDPPVEPPCSSLDLRVVRQPRRGFGLARARNTGARAASHDILVFLDGDVIPEAGLVHAHARWHHAVGDALTQGFCAYVSAEGLTPGAVRAHPGALETLFDGRAFDRPWIERHMARTDDLTSRHTDLFRAVTGHNFAISRALFEEAGAFDESFNRYGGEDTEFAYRVQNSGGLLVPVREAFAWHQGRWLDGRQAKRRDREGQAGKLADLIAEPGFRPGAAARSYAVPRFVVTLVTGTEPVERIVESANALLADPDGDLGVCIDIAPGRDTDRIRLRRRYGHEPRVHVVARTSVLDAFPASPLHVRTPAVATVDPLVLDRLESALGDAVTATADLGGNGGRITIARAWALHRARRTGGTAADYGDTRTLPARALRPARTNAARRAAGPQTAAAPNARAILARVLAEARHVRGPRTAGRFVRWLVAGVRWRVRVGRGRPLSSAHGIPPWRSEAFTAAIPDPPLGIDLVALGPRARAVFAASTRVRHEAGTPPPHAVLADSAQAAAGASAPRVVLNRAPWLAVPAFDPALHNPVGWVRHVENHPVSLGPPHRLPRGASARRAVAPSARGALRHAHRLEDTAEFHPDATARAGTLARIAALGLPVRLADADRALEALLGEPLFGLMTADSRCAGAAEREALSIAQRREALRTHSLRARVRQVCEAAGAQPPRRPFVSVLLATRRPQCLAHAVANVARQSYPHLELVLALHGPGFAAESLDAALAPFTRPVQVLRLDRDHTLGAVLAEATAAASAPLLAKMDDDDLYGPEHVWDLVLAREYSGAALVGKFPATVYLAHADRTVRVREVPPETWSRSVTGGTMLIARTDLQRAGGWRDLPRHVDAALVEDVHARGGGVYRTHDTGYVLLRHGRRHTWCRDDAEFLAAAEAVHPGWRPELAGLAGSAPPPVRPDHD